MTQPATPLRLAKGDAFVEIDADGVIRMGNAEGGLEVGPDGVRLWHRDGSLVLAAGVATLTAKA